MRARVILFKPSGKFYTEEDWEVPADAIGPYDMARSPDYRTIGGGAVLVDTQEPWGYPHLFNREERVMNREHPQQHAKEREVIEYLVTKVLDPAALPKWWDTPLAHAPGKLQGLTPNEAMRYGQGATLHEYVKHYTEPQW